jgi:hypothetical protein
VARSWSQRDLATTSWAQLQLVCCALDVTLDAWNFYAEVGNSKRMIGATLVNNKAKVPVRALMV